MASSSQNKLPGWTTPRKKTSSKELEAINALISALEHQQAELRKHIQKLKELKDASDG